MTVSKKLVRFLNLVGDEVGNAQQKHRPLNSAHEGYSVILEEMDELWSEIKCRVHDRDKILAELIHMTAMCCRFADELIDASFIEIEERRRQL